MFFPLPFLFSSVVSLKRSVFFPLGRAILPNLAIQQQSSESKKRATLLTETWISRNHTAFRDFACHSTEQFCVSPRKKGLRLPITFVYWNTKKKSICWILPTILSLKSFRNGVFHMILGQSPKCGWVGVKVPNQENTPKNIFSCARCWRGHQFRTSPQKPFFLPVSLKILISLETNPSYIQPGDE